MKNPFRTLSLPADRRLIAVSDIHGHLALLRALLEKVHYIPGGDLLFLVGDLVEKGPENLAALRYVQDLCAHGFVYPTMGNVDAFTLSLLDDDSEGNEARFYEYCELRRHFSGSSPFHRGAGRAGAAAGRPRRRAGRQTGAADAFG